MKIMTTHEMIKRCFGLDLLDKETAAFLARAARRFVKMEEKEKHEQEWRRFKKQCRLEYK